MITQLPIDERYLNWLYSLIAPVSIRNPARTYRKLCDHMYKKPFRWIVPNDDNRLEDGRELREEFLDKFVVYDEPMWVDMEVSVFEVLIALSRRAAFESDEPVDLWFWKFMDNLNLRQYNDLLYDQENWVEVDGIIDKLVDRRYKRNGKGGLFPLLHAKKDQREIEIWYQLNAYLLENYDF